MVMQLRGHQTTLKHQAYLKGVGVHSGKDVFATFIPAAPDTGIVFIRQNEAGESVEIPAIASSVCQTSLCTAIGATCGTAVATIEHLMAAIYAMGIDNLIVEIDNMEVPVADGSAEAFVDLFEEAGIAASSAPRRYIRILKTIRIEDGGSWAEFTPYDGTRFDVEIDFETPAIGRQRCITDLGAVTFKKEIARARTFGFLKDVERLWAKGFALGSSLENSVVIGHNDEIINPEGLRFKDEFARHKTLDAIGDIALAGAPFIGAFRSYRGGHRLNAEALRALLSNPMAYEIVEANNQSIRNASRARSSDLIPVNAPVFAPWRL